MMEKFAKRLLEIDESNKKWQLTEIRSMIEKANGRKSKTNPKILKKNKKITSRSVWTIISYTKFIL